jgi:hypothetical protein
MLDTAGDRVGPRLRNTEDYSEDEEEQDEAVARTGRKRRRDDEGDTGTNALYQMLRRTTRQSKR